MFVLMVDTGYVRTAKRRLTAQPTCNTSSCRRSRMARKDLIDTPAQAGRKKVYRITESLPTDSRGFPAAACIHARKIGTVCASRFLTYTK